MIIESITQTTSKTIHVINFNEKKLIRLGRGNDSEVKIADISVSRTHSMIKYHNGCIYVEDYNSKFGTLF